MSGEFLRLALYSLVALVPSLLIHEYAHARLADRLGDPTPRRYGRMTLQPRPHADPFGTVVLPILLALLIAVKVRVPMFAYAKPLPYAPQNLRNPERDMTWIALAGPLANLALALATALAFRVSSTGELGLFLVAALRVNVVLFIFSLMPIPGLDGSLILARFLHGRAREVYTNMAQYLPLFILLIYFLLAAPLLTFVNALGNALCNALVGSDCL